MRDPKDPNNNQADPNKTQKQGQGTKIYWSGTEGEYWNDMYEATKSGRVPAFANLAHELIGHAWMKFKGIERQGEETVFDPRFTGYHPYGVVPQDEIDAVNIENRAMMIENRCVDIRCSTLRTKYGGRDISPYLDFEGFLEGKSRNPKPPRLKPSSRPRN